MILVSFVLALIANHHMKTDGDVVFMFLLLVMGITGGYIYLDHAPDRDFFGTKEIVLGICSLWPSTYLAEHWNWVKLHDVHASFMSQLGMHFLAAAILLLIVYVGTGVIISLLMAEYDY